MSNLRIRHIWPVLLPALFLMLLGAPAPEAALPAGGGGLVTLPDSPPMVALTFDDGPLTRTTSRLLDGLALREVQATFFLVGDRLEGTAPLVQRMAREGHQIGMHSYDHVCMRALSRSDFDKQMEQSRALLVSLVGEGDYWLRPPYGLIDDSVRKWAGCPIVLWSVDPEDWKDQNTQRIVDSVLSHVQDGSIILLHDIYDTSVDAALAIVDALSSQGYCFATVQQLLEAKGITPVAGELYSSAGPTSSAPQS